MPTQDDLDNHADQMNPNQINRNSRAYWESRGHDERPGDWEERVSGSDDNDDDEDDDC